MLLVQFCATYGTVALLHYTIRVKNYYKYATQQQRTYDNSKPNWKPTNAISNTTTTATTTNSNNNNRSLILFYDHERSFIFFSLQLSFVYAS